MKTLLRANYHHCRAILTVLGRWIRRVVIESRLGRAITSLIISLILVAGDYFLENYPYPVLDDVDKLGFTELLSQRMAHEADDSVLYLNVAYDKELVPVADDFGDTIGSAVITDRSVLLHLLHVARHADYRFMVLDVRFEQGFTTEVDSALWAAMSVMPRFAYSIHSESEDAVDAKARHAAALSDYGATLSTGFTRWQYLQKAGESMPLAMYRSIDGGSIGRRGLFYFDNGRLCRNTLFIPLSSDLLLAERDNGEVRYPLLGGQVMRWNTDAELAAMMCGRIVVIGDFEGDTHDTYIGAVPGPAIIHSAYLGLHRGRHLVNWWFTAAMFVLYAAMCAGVLAGGSLWQRFAWVRRHPAVSTLLSFVGWEVVLNLVGIVMYLAFAESFISILPALTLTFLGWARQHVGGSSCDAYRD